MLAARLGGTGLGGVRRRQRRRAADRPHRRRLARLADGPAGGGPHLVAAALPAFRRGQHLAAAGRHAAAYRRRAGTARRGGVPDPARHHPAGMAGQPRPPGGRPHRRLGGRVGPATPPAGDRWQRRRTGSYPTRAARAGRCHRGGAGRRDAEIPVRGVLCLQGGWPGFNGRSRTSTSRLLGNSPTSSATDPRWPWARSSWPPPGCLRCSDRRPERASNPPQAVGLP